MAKASKGTGAATGIKDVAAPALPYRVLARKYRPVDFTTLVGQEAMVRTLRNAIATGRIAHAFMLTGVRGVGKTTTARIIARALNCVGPDGNGGPTVDPCGVCDNCTAITEDRHVDVIEMDAASRTGIDDVRELKIGLNVKGVGEFTSILNCEDLSPRSLKLPNPNGEGGGAGSAYGGQIRIRPGIADVVGYAGGEDDRFLGHKGHALTQGEGIDSRGGNTINQQLSGFRVVKP